MAFNLRLNNHRKDTKKPDSDPASIFNNTHNFIKHAKFIIIGKLVNLHGSKETICKAFEINKLRTINENDHSFE